MHKEKVKVAIMEPVELYRESLFSLLNERFDNRIDITSIVSSISELIRDAMIKGPADIYLMEAFGVNEDYKNWSDFTHFMATHYPSVICLVWSSKPTTFLRKKNFFEPKTQCWQIPKKISIEILQHFLKNIIESKPIQLPQGNLCIGPRMSNLTHNEIIVISGIIDGFSISEISRKFGVAYKTISTHKRNAMIKMRISTTAQLRSLFIDGYIIRGNKERHLPIEFNINQPFKL